jgi:hypothetical protein
MKYMGTPLETCRNTIKLPLESFKVSHTWYLGFVIMLGGSSIFQRTNSSKCFKKIIIKESTISEYFKKLDLGI